MQGDNLHSPGTQAAAVGPHAFITASAVAAALWVPVAAALWVPLAVAGAGLHAKTALPTAGQPQGPAVPAVTGGPQHQTMQHLSHRAHHQLLYHRRRRRCCFCC